MRATSSGEDSVGGGGIAPPPPLKRRRPSPATSSVNANAPRGRAFSSDGADLDVHGTATDSLRQLSELQRGLQSLEATIRRQEKQQQRRQEQQAAGARASGWTSSSTWPSVPVRAHPDPLPPADPELIKAVLAAFPSQSDGEVLLEFVLQEVRKRGEWRCVLFVGRWTD